MRRTTWAGLFAILVSVLAGCDAKVWSQAEVNGKGVAVRVGEEVAVRVVSHRADGYVWSLVEPPRADVLDWLGFDSEGNGASSADEPGSDVVRLQAIGPGTTAFRLECARPVSPYDVADDFVLTVEVR